MLSGNPDFPQKSLQIKQDEKLFSRILSKETNPSFRVYYGGVTGAVPFMWESQPGTPKNKFCDNSLPPLTPPPSYYFTHNDKPIKKYSRSKLLNTLFLRTKEHMQSSPSSSSHSSVATSSNIYRRRRRFLSSGSSFDDRIIYEERVPNNESPNSMLCFGINKDKNGGIIGGGYLVVIMKKALLSMVGRGSG